MVERSRVYLVVAPGDLVDDSQNLDQKTRPQATLIKQNTWSAYLYGDQAQQALDFAIGRVPIVEKADLVTSSLQSSFFCAEADLGSLT